MEDVPALADLFLKRHMVRTHRSGMRLTPAALKALGQFTWPGNVCELDTLIARSVVLSPGEQIGPGQLGLPLGNV